MPDMVSLAIDGRRVSVPPGTLVVEAAKRAGIHIPTFCYHPRLKPEGNCRMCLVEIEKMAKLVTSCTQPVAEGMVVHTNTPQVIKAQEAMLEFLLINHCLDCPVCDKGGECDLQDHTYRYGPGRSRFPHERKFVFRTVDLGPMIRRYMNRCVHCRKCIRVLYEVAGDETLAFFGRGHPTEVATFNDQRVDSNFSGNAITICPVGALTSKIFHFRARAWEVEKHPAVCNMCACGCSLCLQTRSEVVRRAVPRENDAVNESWLCDKGQFGHPFIDHPDRLKEPQVRKNGALAAVGWEGALGLAAERLVAIRNQYGPEAIAGIGSARASNEANYIFARFIRDKIGSQNLDYRLRVLPGSVESALHEGLGQACVTNSIEALEQAPVVLVVGGDVFEEHPIVAIRIYKGWRKGRTRIIVANTYPTRLEKWAHLRLRYRPGTEAALIAGILHTILSEGLANQGFLSERAECHEALAEAVREWAPDRVAQITGVGAEEIAEAARIMAGAPAVAIVAGRTVHQSPDAQEIAAGLVNLGLATGTVEKEHGGIYCLPEGANEQGARDAGLLAPEQGRDTGSLLRAACEGRIKALYVMGNDPARYVLDKRLVDEALAKVEFLLVQDLFLTDTAARAHVVFPAAGYGESEGTYTSLERRVQACPAAIPFAGKASADWEIVAALADAMGQPFAYSSPREILSEMAAGLSGYEELVQASPSPEGTLCLARNPDRRYRCLPIKVSCRAPQPDPDYPLLLVCRPALIDGGNLASRSEVLRAVARLDKLLLAKEDATRLGVDTGTAVQVVSPLGTVSATAEVEKGAAPGAGVFWGDISSIRQVLDPAGAYTPVAIRKGT